MNYNSTLIYPLFHTWIIIPYISWTIQSKYSKHKPTYVWELTFASNLKEQPHELSFQLLPCINLKPKWRGFTYEHVFKLNLTLLKKTLSISLSYSLIQTSLRKSSLIYAYMQVKPFKDEIMLSIPPNSSFA